MALPRLIRCKPLSKLQWSDVDRYGDTYKPEALWFRYGARLLPLIAGVTEIRRRQSDGGLVAQLIASGVKFTSDDGNLYVSQVDTIYIEAGYLYQCYGRDVVVDCIKLDKGELQWTKN